MGVPLRATVHSFGPILLSKVLGLNATQESSLSLVFHYADTNNLLLLDLKDLTELLKYLVSDEGKADLADIGGAGTGVEKTDFFITVAAAAAGTLGHKYHGPFFRLRPDLFLTRRFI